MKNPEILLSFDIEEFDLPEEYKASVPEEDKFEISRCGTRAIIELMKETGAKATFFTTAVFAMRYPELIRQGYQFEKTMETGKNRYGKTDRYMRYRRVA